MALGFRAVHIHWLTKKPAEVLEDEDPWGGAFRQVMCPHPGEFAPFKKKMLMLRD